MAKKRKQVDLRKKVDKSSQKYWEEIISRDFPMSAGTSTHLVYVGDNTVLERIAGEREMGVVPHN